MQGSSASQREREKAARGVWKRVQRFKRREHRSASAGMREGRVHLEANNAGQRCKLTCASVSPILTDVIASLPDSSTKIGSASPSMTLSRPTRRLLVEQIRGHDG